MMRTKKAMQLSLPLSPVLCTAGYQGRSLDEMVNVFLKAGVRRVVDVRFFPTSRRPGFAKTPFSTALRESGIDYIHVREAGNPFRDDGEHGLERYAAHLDSHPEIVQHVAHAVGEEPSVLICFERKAEHCHRQILAERVAAILKQDVVKL